MTMTDPIADMLTRIRNANSAGFSEVLIPASNMKVGIAGILAGEGYIEGYEVVKGSPSDQIKVLLKYGPNKERTLIGLKRISTPGLRVYAKKTQLPRVLGGLGIAIISTSRGIMTEKEAKVKDMGGEVVCYVW